MKGWNIAEAENGYLIDIWEAASGISQGGSNSRLIFTTKAEVIKYLEQQLTEKE